MLCLREKESERGHKFPCHHFCYAAFGRIITGRKTATKTTVDGNVKVKMKPYMRYF